MAEFAYFWYGFKSAKQFWVDNPRLIEQQWRGLWFAKGDAQRVVDSHLKTYANLIDDDAPVEITQQTLMHAVGQMLVWDQLPRNIYRGQPESYTYDGRAQTLARLILAAPFAKPLHVRVSLAICFVHGEDMESQLLARQLADDASHALTLHNAELAKALTTICGLHAERISLFGRFPERNRILGRKTTTNEAAYLEALYA